MKKFQRKEKHKPVTNRDYFAGQAIQSLIIRDEDCENLAVEAYFVADHMLLTTDERPWKSPTGRLREYFASQIIGAVIEARMDKKYSPKEAFKMADEMIQARKRQFVE
jgi:hypothetical protein